MGATRRSEGNQEGHNVLQISQGLVDIVASSLSAVQQGNQRPQPEISPDRYFAMGTPFFLQLSNME